MAPPVQVLRGSPLRISSLPWDVASKWHLGFTSSVPIAPTSFIQRQKSPSHSLPIRLYGGWMVSLQRVGPPGTSEWNFIWNKVGIFVLFYFVLLLDLEMSSFWNRAGSKSNDKESLRDVKHRESYFKGHMK